MSDASTSMTMTRLTSTGRLGQRTAAMRSRRPDATLAAPNLRPARHDVADQHRADAIALSEVPDYGELHVAGGITEDERPAVQNRRGALQTAAVSQHVGQPPGWCRR